MSKDEANQDRTGAVPAETDPQALLEAANRASQRLSVLHIAFMAVCAYVLVIVFGTTDLDLLVGKGIKLPVVEMDVPIVGFYTFAPYIVVLVHFNLLLQLQLLSRKLFAFDAAVPKEEGVGGLRDRLHIFPFTYYIVGRPSHMVLPLVALMVSITLVLLPIITLLSLQLRFLAYQSETVVWLQRIAIWIDIIVITILWPVILHPKDDWRGYWRDLIDACLPRLRVFLSFVLLFAGLVLSLFGAMEGFFLAGIILLLVSALSVIPLLGWKTTSLNFKLYVAFLVIAALFSGAAGIILLIPLAVLWHPKAPRGGLALLLTLFIGTLLPLALLVDGEKFEHLVVSAQGAPNQYTCFSDSFLKDKRSLNLDEQVLLAKSPRPEPLALIRSGEWQEGLKQIEPISLHGRSLRHAKMAGAILTGADLRGAQLQGAILGYAQLQGADLRGAQLQGANLRKSQLQGANLARVQLLGANLRGAQLQGADLMQARLLGANLIGAQLQGSILVSALLKGANLGGAQLQGADLSKANLYAADFTNAKTELIDARWVKWDRDIWHDDILDGLINQLKRLIKDKNHLKNVQANLKRAAHTDAVKIHMQSCLLEGDEPIICEKRYDSQMPDELSDFTQQLHAYLGRLACEAPEIALGIIYQINDPNFKIRLGVPIKDPIDPIDRISPVPVFNRDNSSRNGLVMELSKRLEDENCRGLQGLSSEEKKILRRFKSESLYP